MTIAAKRKLVIGDIASSFILKDQNKTEINLTNFKGKKVLLSFHPLAWTSVCAKQMQALETNWQRFQDLTVVPLGISVDPLPAKKAWADSLAIEKTSLLSDFWPHGEIAKLYGLFREGDGFSERAKVIIDENQNIIFLKVYDISELPSIEELFAFLEKNQ